MVNFLHILTYGHVTLQLENISRQYDRISSTQKNSILFNVFWTLHLGDQKKSIILSNMYIFFI